jgi:hydroxymethylpyrimidine pyrophosphatase-like HAD family hydrolase
MSRIVVALDLDHTTIPWIPDAPPAGPFIDEEVFQETIRFFNRPEVRDHLFLVFSTGRGPRALSKILPLLEHFPVDAVSINNGKRVFTRPSGAAPAEWIRGFAGLEPLREWDDHLRTRWGWDQDVADELLARFLKMSGFRRLVPPHPLTGEVSDDPVWVKLYKNLGERCEVTGEDVLWLIDHARDESGFAISLSHHHPDLPLQEYAESLAEGLGAMHLERGISFIHQVDIARSHPDKLFVFYGPESISKQSSLEYLVRHAVKECRGVITGGDSLNDLELLTAEEYAGTLNYPVLVGAHSTLASRMEEFNLPLLVRTEVHSLVEGLKEQWDRCRSLSA